MTKANPSNSLSEHLKVGEVADACDVSADTIRFYEDKGLIPEPPRFESSGYRAYPPETIERVQFIQNAQDLGFTLEEVGELLDLRATDEASCSEVRQVAERKAEDVRRRIARLEEILEGLESLTSLCPGDVPSDRCPFLNVLANS
ncbi:MAG: heavy metal-responsive transcriptional regulator, partial [Bradymonadaceae bacterium]